MARRGRAGRGQLSSIDLLPEECRPHVAWANQELAQNERTAQDIWEELNDRLEPLGQEISRSAFGRHSVRLAETTARMAETDRIVSAMGERMAGRSSDDLTIMVAELGKTLVFEILQGAGAGGVSPKGAMELAAALKSFNGAQATSSKRRVELEREAEDRIEAEVEKVVEKVSTEAGLTAERAAEIRRKVLGVRTAPPEAGPAA